MGFANADRVLPKHVQNGVIRAGERLRAARHLHDVDDCANGLEQDVTLAVDGRRKISKPVRRETREAFAIPHHPVH